MWRLMIADDEPKIRGGLRKSVNWEDKGIVVIGEAEDGEEALERARSLQPDVMLVDICMPFLNGLELIKKLKFDLPHCIFIVITGYDEFSYAQQAVKLEVFDFLLKPVILGELISVIDKAIETLQRTKEHEQYFNWVHQKIEDSSLLQTEFFKKWMNEFLTMEEIEEELRFLNLDLQRNLEMILVKPIIAVHIDKQGTIWDKKSQEFAIKNLVTEHLKEYNPYVVFVTDNGNIVALTPATKASPWVNLESQIEREVEKTLGFSVFVSRREISNGFVHVTRVYHELLQDMAEKSNLTPIVRNAKKFIDSYYNQRDLTLNKMAAEMQVSPTYLSKLLKKELGYSFIDYLTSVRVLNAIRYLNNPTSKMYEIAERVGYNSQHYFSNAFKKTMGVSPIAYRKRSDYHRERS